MNLVNISNKNRTIYLFLRDKKGNQVIKRDTSFFPYFYEPDQQQGEFKSYDGVPLRKVFVSEPSQVPKVRSVNSYSSDIPFIKRYLIDKVDKIDKCPIRYFFIDTEMLSKELPDYKNPKSPITVISLYDNFTNKYYTWAIKSLNEEKQLLENFVKFFKNNYPDTILAWNVTFDINYIYARYKKLFKKDFSRDISPIREIRRGETEDIFYPQGISILDYMQLFKKVFRQEASYALDYIAPKYLEEEKSYGKVFDFSKISIEMKEKCLNDVKRMVKLEKKFRLLDYFDELRRLTKCLWEDLYYNSRIIEMLIFEEAKQKNIILPNTPRDNKKESFQGAIREAYELGVHYDCSKVDVACFSEDTQLLTLEGWKNYNELKLGEKIASFNLKNHRITFQPLLALYVYKFENKYLYSFKTGGMNQLLTPHHRVLYKTTCKAYKEGCFAKWKICFAKDLPTNGHVILPLSFPIDRSSDYSISDDLLKLHAWIITEGDERYNIYQSEKKHPKFCKEIDEIFSKLNWKVKKSVRRQGEVTWRIPSCLKKIYIKLEENYKVIPLWMLQKLSYRQLKILFEELMKGDGDSSRLVYYAKNELAKERFQILCTLLGYTSYYNKNSKEVYIKPNKYTVVKKSKVKYSGIVWCPSVQNGFVVVRRPYQRPFISGNSAYPSVIYDFCLDSKNILTHQKTNSPVIEINGIKFIQDQEALLPSIVKKMLTLKSSVKNKLKQLDPQSEEYKNTETLYAAIKAVANSIFGITGFYKFRLFDVRVASTITFLVRDLLLYIKNKIEELGYKVIYIDTDGIIYKGEDNIIDKINKFTQQWVKEKYNKEETSVKFEYEGCFSKLFILTLCRYKGELITSKGAKWEEKGIEAKRSDSTVFMKEFQEKLLNKLFEGQNKEQVKKWIEEQKEEIKKRPIEEVAFPCKIANRTYKNEPIFLKAYKYTQKLYPKFKVNKGELFYYIFVKPFGEEVKERQKEGKTIKTKRLMNVLAFTLENKSHINKDIIDYNEVIRRNIDLKVDKIFEAMGWKERS